MAQNCLDLRYPSSREKERENDVCMYVLADRHSTSTLAYFANLRSSVIECFNPHYTLIANNLLLFNVSAVALINCDCREIFHVHFDFIIYL